MSNLSLRIYKTFKIKIQTKDYADIPKDLDEKRSRKALEI